MRLFEKVAAARHPLLVQHPRLGSLQLPGASAHSAQIADVEARYVLMDDMTRTCGSLIMDQPDLLSDCTDILRLPSSLFWIEWANWELQPDGDHPRSTPRQRGGVLVQCDETGRSGTMASFWDAPDDGADRCPAILHFDLDDDTLRPPEGSCPEAYRKLYAKTKIVIDVEWQRYYAVAAPDATSYAAVVDDMASTLCKDFAVLASFSLMMSLRSELAIIPSDLERLNRARAKHGKRLLLDYAEVSSRLLGQRGVTQHLGPYSAHQGPRLHHVRGHFVRRAQKIFWRRTHLRGDLGSGIAPVRTARVSL